MAKKKVETKSKKNTKKNTKNTSKKNTTKKPVNTKTKSKAKKEIKKESKNDSGKNIAFELRLIIFTLIAVVLILSVHGVPMGIVGIATRDVLSGLFSVSMYFIPYFILALAIINNVKKLKDDRKRYNFSLLSLFFAQTLFIGNMSKLNAVPIKLSFDEIAKVYLNGTEFKGAGLIGNLIYVPLRSILGDVGIIILIVCFVLVFLILGSRFTFSGIFKLFKRKEKKDDTDCHPERSEQSERTARSLDSVEMIETVTLSETNDSESSRTGLTYNDYDDYDDDSALKMLITDKKRKKNSEQELRSLDSAESLARDDTECHPERSEQSERSRMGLTAEEEHDDFKFIDIPVKENKVSPLATLQGDDTECRPERSEQSEVSPLATLQGDDTECHPERSEQSERSRTGLTDIPHYVLPPISILMKGSSNSNLESELDITNKAAILEETFKSFKVDARVTNVVKGPVITRFEVMPEAGVKISKIATLSDDIALRLAATNVRILAPIPGKSAVGIEVPNDDVSVVRLRDVLESKEYEKSNSKIKFALGKDISGAQIVPDLAKMPHLLIAGATGSGKSVCVNTIIASILFNATPDEVKFLMIDPKVVELSVYNGIPHLLLPVVTDANKASIALSWAVNEMNKRYQKFAEYRVRDINSYNEKYKMWKEEREQEITETITLSETNDSESSRMGLEQVTQENTSTQQEEMEFMPRIVIIIDELADLMVVAQKQVEESIARIAQMARAAGMHLIVATQRPSVDVITGLIKANIPSRIAFAVSSSIDSRTILDEQGADKLLGKGDMLFLNAGKSKPTRVQGCFVTDNEVEALVQYVKNQFEGELEYDENVVDASNVKALDFGNDNDNDSDELLDAAIQFVLQSDKASTSMIQRKFRIGYNRAARIVEEMEEKGIVGPSRGAKPREVLINSAVWEAENEGAEQT